MSRSDRLMTRIEDALRGIKVETSEVFCHDMRESPFGIVNLVTFIWRVAENDVTADSIAREVSNQLADKNICVTFHKTRRQQGERLLTASRALDTGNKHYTYGKLLEFTRGWLIEMTQANDDNRKKPPASQRKGNDKIRFKM